MNDMNELPNELPKTLLPGESINLELTPEAIEAINNGRAIEMHISIAMPFPLKCIIFPLAFYGLYTIISDFLYWLFA